MNIFLEIIKVCVVLVFVLSCTGDRQQNGKTSDVDERRNKMSKKEDFQITLNFDERFKVKTQHWTVSSTDAKNEIIKWLEENTKVDQRFGSLAVIPVVVLEFKDKSISIFDEYSEDESELRSILSFFNKFLIEGSISNQVIQTSGRLEEARVYFTTKEK